MPGLTRFTQPTPLGPMVAVMHGPALCILEFEDQPDRLARALRHHPTPRPAPGEIPALDAYFAGHLPALDTIEITPAGTPFQHRAWSALRRIPPGTTTTYAALAATLTHPSPRAVGATNAANPIAIILPCHRLVATSGHLTGYGGGLPRKAWLLAHEHRHA